MVLQTKKPVLYAGFFRCLPSERRARGRSRFQRAYSANSVISVG